MSYTVKLKDQTGTEVTYSAIEQVTIPLASGGGNAIFTAQYNVSKIAATNIEYDGGAYASHDVDYLCRISTGSSGKSLADSITVKVSGNELAKGEGYEYTKLSSSEAFVKIVGSYITGNIEIRAVTS